MKYFFIILFSMTTALLCAQENNSLNCSDGIDNDGDGLIDCDDPECQSLINNGCATCFDDGLSFADDLISYSPTCLSTNIAQFPSRALGVANSNGSSNPNNSGADYVSLGEGGNIKLGFSNNVLINSGDSEPDVWVFEVGNDVESSTIALRPLNSAIAGLLDSLGISDSDMDGYYEFGTIAGSTSSIDIDLLTNNLPYNTLKFDAISISDIDNASCGDTPGADIDAVCALSSYAAEICDNGIDDDNNGEIDESCEPCEFQNDYDDRAEFQGNVCVLGQIQIGDAIRLQPRNTAPSNPTMGTLYFDKSIFKLRVWDGTNWKNCSE